MNFFALSSILVAISTLTMATILFLSTNKPKENIVWAYFCISVFIWGVGGYFASMTLNKERALFWWQIANIGSIFSPVIFYHFILEYLKHKKGILLTTCYSLGIILLIINFFFSDLYLGEISIIFNQFYYMDWIKDKNIIYLLFYIAFYWLLLLYSFFLLVKEFLTSKGNRRNQMKYFIVGMSIGWLGGCADFMIIFGIPVYPYSNILIAIYPLILGFAMSRYRLMDIRLIATNIGIFLLVYSLILSIPFGLGYKLHYWQQSLWLMFLLATIGPYIYSYLRKQAENKLLQEQIAYQKTLKQAAYGIGRVKKLDTLLKLIERTLTKSVGIEQCAVYLIDEKEEKEKPAYTLTNKNKSAPSYITIPTEVVNTLKKHSEPFILEELSYHNQNHSNAKNMVEFLKTFNAEIAIPIIQSNRLLSLILLGKKKNNSLYTNDDLTVFTILASQAGLAIENCLFIDAEQERLKREGTQARRESLDMLVSTMAHEIDNPIQGAIGQAEMLKICLDFFRYNLPKETMDEVLTYCERIDFHCRRVSKIVKAVEDYSKRETGNYKSVDWDAVIVPYHSLVPMIRKKNKKVQYTEDIAENLPPVWAEEIMIEEILMNLVENAYHAVIHNKAEMKVHLHIFKKDNDYIRLEVNDNGYGIAPKIKRQLFEVPTTTKGSSEGTGIGLYRIRQICELLKAKYGAESEGRGHGAVFYVEIPIYKGKTQLKEGI